MPCLLGHLLALPAGSMTKGKACSPALPAGSMTKGEACSLRPGEAVATGGGGVSRRLPCRPSGSEVAGAPRGVSDPNRAANPGLRGGVGPGPGPPTGVEESSFCGATERVRRGGGSVSVSGWTE